MNQTRTRKQHEIADQLACLHRPLIYRNRYSVSMPRTTVEIDEILVRRVMRLYGLPTKRAAIDFALRALVGDRPHRDMLDLEGAGWDGDLVGTRTTRVPKP